MAWCGGGDGDGGSVCARVCVCALLFCLWNALHSQMRLEPKPLQQPGVLSEPQEPSRRSRATPTDGRVDPGEREGARRSAEAVECPRDPVLSREGWFFTPLLEEPGFSAGFLMEKRGCKPLTSRKSPGTAQEGCILSLAVLVSLFRANTHAESSEGELA